MEYGKLRDKANEIREVVNNTGNRFELDLLDYVGKELSNMKLDRYTYIELDKMTELITKVTSIYEPKRKRDTKNLNNILEIIRLYREMFYIVFAKKEEEKEQAQERRAAFKVV
ncbi:hypothetical protein Q9R38_25980 [Priestia aryabhattai]|uniref:hypothetical protein n=1 Tax=Priestia aryabhattai TaxID=412384 RepID=UPI0028821520|nr:hypothetical protein [Priestia aryabhattai]MDT0149993.1 hypothetical protein [Priestia aryabhattai]MDT0155563.1 hypothetical protein [Priestia aryabhattai]